MKIDVYFCTTNDQSRLRLKMRDLCYDRWLEESDVDLHLITPSIIDCSAREFQRSRRIFADRHAKSSIYVVADDDCFITPNSTTRLLGLMESHPQHVILAPLPVGFISPSVHELSGVGGIRFCRHVPDLIWPQLDGGPGYDALHCQAIRHQLGLHFSYAFEVPVFHLGEGYSTVWKENK